LIDWPKYGAAIWGIFNRLGRPSSMGGLMPISMIEIDAWQRVHDIRLTPWELEIIELFDGIALEVSHKQGGK
jgi:hypothetical protein